jgi:hypothetical protein
MGLSRRMFLKQSSMAVAIAGVATTMPLLSEVAQGPPASDGAAATSEVSEGSQLTEDLVAHVRDLSRGEINLYIGQRQIVLNDPGLARALFQATR